MPENKKEELLRNRDLINQHGDYQALLNDWESETLKLQKLGSTNAGAFGVACPDCYLPFHNCKCQAWYFYDTAQEAASVFGFQYKGNRKDTVF